MKKNLDAIFNPLSIAVIGATNRFGSFGLTATRNLMNAGFGGTVYTVNPNRKVVQCNKAYPSVSDIPDVVDLAVIIVPAATVPGVLDDAGKKGVKGAIIISAGFKETGTTEGANLENQIKKARQKYGISIFGPNCLGVINTGADARLNASVATRMAQRGNIAFMSQSGTLCTAVLDYASERNIGFSKFIGFGNKADINEIDLLHFLKEDAETDVIVMYLEDISNGREFLDTARDVVWGAKKPILAVKSGHIEEKSTKDLTHTGALACSDDAYDALFRQSGIIRVEGVSELFHYAAAFSQQPIPKGERIAIITNAGGPGIMATDAVIRHGLKMAPLTKETEMKLRETLPATAATNNPVDVIGDATHERYGTAVRYTIQDENVDAAIVILSPQAMTDVLQTAAIIPRVVKEINKPVLCSFMGIVDVSPGVKYLQENGIPNYAFPEAAVRSLAAMFRFGNLLNLKNRQIKTIAADRSRAHNLIKENLTGKDQILMTENESDKILACYGFPLLNSALINDPCQLKEVCGNLGFPVAMKVASPDVSHKYDAGGVLLKIKNLEEAHTAYTEIMNNVKSYDESAKIKGVLIQKMAGKGVEVILGAYRDPKFGPMCMFGLGGAFVEALRDISFRLAPMWEVSAEQMIKSIKSYKILQGIRGNPAADTEAIKECILRLSQMITDHPEIAELDINPLLVYPRGEGCVAADCRIVLRKDTQ
jgi:acetyltransferase